MTRPKREETGPYMIANGKIRDSAKNSRYPFRFMRPRQVVFLPGATSLGKEAAAAYMLAKRRGWKFTMRAINGGLRVRRVE